MFKALSRGGVSGRFVALTGNAGKGYTTVRVTGSRLHIGQSSTEFWRQDDHETLFAEYRRILSEGKPSTVTVWSDLPVGGWRKIVLTRAPLSEAFIIGHDIADVDTTEEMWEKIYSIGMIHLLGLPLGPTERFSDFRALLELAVVELTRPVFYFNVMDISVSPAPTSIAAWSNEAAPLFQSPLNP